MKRRLAAVAVTVAGLVGALGLQAAGGLVLLPATQPPVCVHQGDVQTADGMFFDCLERLA